MGMSLVVSQNCLTVQDKKTIETLLLKGESEKMKLFVLLCLLLSVPFRECCISRFLPLEEEEFAGCPPSCLSPCEASNYAGTSSCSYNQAKGIFFLDSIVTTKTCSECYPELAAVAARKETVASRGRAAAPKVERASATTAAAFTTTAAAAASAAGATPTAPAPAAVTTAAAATSAVAATTAAAATPAAAATTAAPATTAAASVVTATVTTTTTTTS